jgi:hypothetical protein
MSLNRVSANGANVFIDIETANSGYGNTSSNSVSVSIAVDYTSYVANIVSTLQSMLATDQQAANTLSTISGTLSTMSGTLTTISNNLQILTNLGSGNGDGIRFRSVFGANGETITATTSRTGNTNYVTVRTIG